MYSSLYLAIIVVVTFEGLIVLNVFNDLQEQVAKVEQATKGAKDAPTFNKFSN